VLQLTSDQLGDIFAPMLFRNKPPPSDATIASREFKQVSSLMKELIEEADAVFEVTIHPMASQGALGSLYINKLMCAFLSSCPRHLVY
jgi:hypothetical protein